MQVVFRDLPPRIRGMTVRDYDDGENYYTIVLNSSLSAEMQRAAYKHEMRHIEREDFDSADVEEIERGNHEEN